MPNDIDIHVGKRLRKRREILGISQNTLGQELDVTYQQIQKYEAGTNRIGGSNLLKIARCLSAPIEYFFVGLDGNPMPEYMADKLDSDTSELIATIGKMKPETRRKVRDLLILLSQGKYPYDG